ncbi:unnamed protein product [Tuber aestivum]|uniref:Uncharacterized protein n=1 Tax=Tuber aestivum TaxID=59557 RepID=A0A292PW62_9PEZI|nr:unnamed protein product [Tuber aestivum]
MLFRIATARRHLLDKVEVYSATGDKLVKGSAANKTLGRSLENNVARNVYLPLDLGDGSHPSLKVVSSYSRIFIYHFSEGFLYTKASHYTENFVQHIFSAT